MFGWVVAGTLVGFAFLTLCDLHFDCGCVLPGQGGATHCDIRTAGAPDCPWCDHVEWAAVVVLVSYGVGLAVATAAARHIGWAGTLLLCLIAILGSIMVGGIITSLLTGRPVLAGL